MIDQCQLRNSILSHLSADDYGLLADHLEPCRCEAREVLIGPDLPIAYVYFLESGVASVIAHLGEGGQAEGGLIGREGVVHPAAVLGADRIPYVVQMMIADAAHRIDRGRFADAIRASASLRDTLLLFAQAYAVQASSTTLANAVRLTEQRLARWLLMYRDRSKSDDLPLTHDFMAAVLSVRRPSVTNALHVLEGYHLLRSERGCVTIRDRAALEQFAGDIYGKPEAEYRRLLWPM